MKMTQDFILLQKIEKKDVKIIIPDSVNKEGARKEADVFIVKESGPGIWQNGKFIDNDIKKNNRVLIAGFVSMMVEGKVIDIGKARDVVAVL